MGRREKVGFAGPAQETAAVFVRIPKAEAERLDRTAFELKRTKQEIVTSLVRALPDDARGDLALGRHSFRTVESFEVLDLEQLVLLLAADAGAVRDLVERGEIPGRKIGDEWRFSRAAVLEWLGARA